ncbi:acyl-CoA dehydrogenase family protein [Rhodococcus wratislaviensis]|uniref:Acyl-[acyl-carrier-protein] dehydrogenase MbtN n=1 Tax=Rhodococcus wratislaviensis NBRC 100605 TaxID=1219028 RepID=X0R9C7_RHOWR|nr:acyl-CoA dehydrogenase family protein [Rhodococcus wratislaviensis]GAF47590.1 acyl-CoA dehydrogenase [Rhodococcus wratislaviensis NBRC 100605]
MTAEYVSPWMNDELEALRDSATRFFTKEAVPAMPKWSEQRHVDREFWLAAGKMGLLCPTVPEEFGGAGGNILHQIAITEAQSRTVEKGWGNNVHSGVVTDYILNYGTREQCERWLPAMVEGRIIGAIAMTESGAGSDVRAMKCRARRDGDEYVIDGAKTFITNGLTADLVIVAVKTEGAEDPKAITLIAVEAGTPGFERGQPLRKIGQHAADTAELFFDSCRVPVSNRIGDEGAGFPALMTQMPQERLILGVNAVVQTEKAVALTLEYVKERKVFGKPLFAMQNTRFVLAECQTMAKAARLFLDHCIVAHSNGVLDNTTAAMAKWWLSDIQCKVLDECVQLWGGYGYMEEYAIARMYADSRVQKVYGGANEIMKEIIARSL